MSPKTPTHRSRADTRLARLQRDAYGYLLNPADWDTDLAHELAAEESLRLDERHFEVAAILRAFHKEYDLSPATRVLARLVREQLGEEKGTSLYLMKLFPGGAVKQGCKIAGLPRPTQCF